MSELLVEKAGAVETWTLNAEPRRNALSRALVAAFSQEVATVSASRRARAVIVTGAGTQAFCAGADLKERSTMSQSEVRGFLQHLKATFRSLETSPVVFIAYVNGVAFGGGTELALACDVRMAAPHAQFGLTETSLGIIPGAGGTQRLPRLVGIGQAKRLILGAQRIGANEALALGLVEQIGSLEDARAYASAVAQNAPVAVGWAKEAMDAGAPLGLDDALNVEQRCYERTLATEDRLEGLLAFAQKRRPDFKGR